MANLRVAQEGENCCMTCKHNCIKIMLGIKFVTDDPCTGVCNHPDSGIYYNCVKFTCELWEGKECSSQ